MKMLFQNQAVRGLSNNGKANSKYLICLRNGSFYLCICITSVLPQDNPLFLKIRLLEFGAGLCCWEDGCLT